MFSTPFSTVFPQFQASKTTITKEIQIQLKTKKPFIKSYFYWPDPGTGYLLLYWVMMSSVMSLAGSK